MTHSRHLYISIFTLLLCSTFWFSACDSPQEEVPTSVEAVQPDQAKVKNPDQRETTIGPVHARVVLDNKTPTLGDQITLTLTVDAESDVTVTMPDFGDQMGRFNIADYKSTETLRDDGRYEFSQIYTLDLPMSGKLTTPSFLVEFIDNRAESDQRGKIQEILTEAMTFEVASVFADGEVPEELYPLQGTMEELVLPTSKKSKRWMYFAMAAGLNAMAGAAYLRLRKPVPKVILPPDVVALKALDVMQARQIPTDPKGIDAWYVELSGIVRTYIEGRFDIHAPRLTTEEFFELARKNDELKDEDKILIRTLLERSDRVKFTDFIPPSDESLAILQDARRFVMDTRIAPETKEAENA